MCPLVVDPSTTEQGRSSTIEMKEGGVGQAKAVQLRAVRDKGGQAARSTLLIEAAVRNRAARVSPLDGEIIYCSTACVAVSKAGN